MKKFALLGAVAALATAGGVFAAWSFAEGNYNTSFADNYVSVTADTIQNNTNIGLATVTNNVEMHFADDDAAGNGLKVTGQGSVTVTYTSYTVESIKENLTISATLSSTFNYSGFTCTVGTITPEVFNDGENHTVTFTYDASWFTFKEGENNPSFETRNELEGFLSAVKATNTFKITINVAATV